MDDEVVERLLQENTEKKTSKWWFRWAKVEEDQTLDNNQEEQNG